MKDVENPLRGVNLGGWLVLERWMTPSLFSGSKATDELDLTLERGKAHILNHRRNFIQESDFEWMKDNGVEAIRVPVGYWILGDQDGYASSSEVLDWCFDMAAKYDLKVLLGFHAAPGAQNKADHSGNGPGLRPLWFKKRYRDYSTDMLLKLAERYGKCPNLWGVSLLNEPTSLGLVRYIKLRLWTGSVVKRLRQSLPSSVRLVLSDAYVFRLWYRAVKSETLDIHHYQCHGGKDKQMTNSADHLMRVDKEWSRYRQMLGKRSYIVGEWTAVLPSTVKTTKEITQQYITRQQDNFKGSEAIFYWSYKTEHEGRWSYRSMVDKGYRF